MFYAYICIYDPDLLSHTDEQNGRHLANSENENSLNHEEEWKENNQDQEESKHTSKHSLTLPHRMIQTLITYSFKPEKRGSRIRLPND